MHLSRRPWHDAFVTPSRTCTTQPPMVTATRAASCLSHPQTAHTTALRASIVPRDVTRHSNVRNSPVQHCPCAVFDWLVRLGLVDALHGVALAGADPTKTSFSGALRFTCRWHRRDVTSHIRTYVELDLPFPSTFPLRPHVPPWFLMPMQARRPAPPGSHACSLLALACIAMQAALLGLIPRAS